MELIDKNALIHDIAYSIRLADEWAKEATEKGDRIELKFAADTHRSLLSMISRVKEFPTIEAEPVRHGLWIEGTSRGSYSIYCSYCGSYKETICPSDYCPDCGARMDAEDINVLAKDGGADNG